MAEVFCIRSHFIKMNPTVQEKRLRAFEDDDGLVFELRTKLPDQTRAMFIHRDLVRDMHAKLGQWLEEQDNEGS